MEEKRNVPKLRFPGFTDPWEQRRLGDEFEFLRNNTLSRAELSDSEGSCFDVHYGDVLIKFGSVIDLEKMALPRIASDKMASRLTCDKLRNGDVVVADTAEDEAAGKCVELRKIGDATVYPGLHTMPLRPLRRYAPGFLGHYLNSSSFRDQLKPLMQGIKVISVSRAVIAGTSLIVPAIDEQDAIAKTFAKLDSLIALHQRELDHVKELKKGLLQKMFPKEGTNAPELRFPGFTDPWEQRRLGDEFDRINERNDGSFGREHWISVSRMFFQDPEAVQSNNIDTRTYVMREGDIAFEGHPNADFQFGRFVANDIGDGVVSELFPVYRHKVNYDNSYWKYAIQLERIMAPIFAKAITSSGNSSNKLDSTHFLKQQILVPGVVEQQAIGALFQKLDSLIALHQRELDHVKELKKGLLQQMFV